MGERYTPWYMPPSHPLVGTPSLYMPPSHPLVGTPPVYASLSPVSLLVLHCMPLLPAHLTLLGEKEASFCASLPVSLLGKKDSLSPFTRFTVWQGKEASLPCLSVGLFPVLCPEGGLLVVLFPVLCPEEGLPWWVLRCFMLRRGPPMVGFRPVLYPGRVSHGGF